MQGSSTSAASALGPRPGDDDRHQLAYVGFSGLANLVARAADRALDSPA